MTQSVDKHAGLHFPLEGIPALGQGLAVREGIQWFRLALPFALDHVNCWLLGEPGNHVLIDTGVNNRSSREQWQQSLAHLPQEQGVPVPEQLLITHFHPDHMGLAGWFGAAGSQLFGSRIESDTSRLLWAIADQDYGGFYASWYMINGLPADTVEATRTIANNYRKIVHQPPAEADWKYLAEGQSVELGGHRYEVLVGRGHAPDMLMLYRSSDHVLIAADQVLSSITPNVSVAPLLADTNPLGSFLETLERLKSLPEDTLVLPSHGVPFQGLHAKLAALEVHHELRLEEVRLACVEPQSAHDMFKVLFHRELDAQQTFFALGESLAHLHYLEQRKQLLRVDEAGGTKFVQHGHSQL